MKIIKFNNFNRLNEDLNDTPEQYIKGALIKIKNKLEKMFEAPESDQNKIQNYSQKQEEESKTSLYKSGLEIESLELSRYSRTLDNVKLKFSDDEFLYDLMVAIDLKEALPKNGKQFNTDDIKKCFIKFKKYDKHEPGEVLGEITDNVNIDEINEDFLISLKLKLDEESGESSEEEFKIETE
jgi:hypothetical protein